MPAKKRTVRKAARRRTVKRVVRRAKKPVRRARKLATPAAKVAALGTPVGTVSHYFTNIRVGVIELRAPLRVGERIRVVGATTNFEQSVGSMQIEHRPVTEAGAGDSVGLKVADRVRQGDTVYRV